MLEPDNIVLNIKNLDNLIRHWRGVLSEDPDDIEQCLVAQSYIDAFQTVRVNHGLPLLPIED